MTTCFFGISQTEKVTVDQIPLLSYQLFYKELVTLLDDPVYQVVSYYGFKEQEYFRFVCVVLERGVNKQYLTSYKVLIEPDILLASIGQHHTEVLCFEQAIANNANANYMNITFTHTDIVVPSKHVVNPILLQPPELHPASAMSFIVYTDD